jgi:hypothetical protein
MSVEFALIWTLIAFGSMYACYKTGIREERARWSRRIERHLKRRLILQDIADKEMEE